MILGIDLGTSNSMAAVYKDGHVVLIKSRTGSVQIPSVVNVGADGFFYTGEVAKERKSTHVRESVDMFKRSMGTQKIYTMGDKKIRSEELSAILLKSIKEDAEAFMGEEITDAVLCVPAFFNNAQRKAVIAAGKMAGFHVKRIVNEPTAAAIAYGIQSEENENKVIAVLDLGGGTFDISVMEISENVMEVVAVCGNNKLGGCDFTKRLTELFLKENGIGEEELTKQEEAMLWNEAEKAKLKINESGKGKLRCVIGGQEYFFCITEEEYEKACYDLLENIRQLTIKAVDESKYDVDEISDIIMVGGGMKLTFVKKMIEKMAGKKLDYKINPDEAVATGAALQGALLEKDEGVKDFIMTDICPYYIGVDIWDFGNYDSNREFDVIMPKNTVIPARRIVKHYHHPGLAVNYIIQSEDKYGINRSPIGEIYYRRPNIDNQRLEVQKIITYDINGIIYVEYYVPSNGMRYKTVLMNEEGAFTEEEISQRMQELKNMDLGPRDREEDKLIMARAERLYSECLNQEREAIDVAVSQFEKALYNGKERHIKEARQNLIRLMDRIENAERRLL